MRITRLASGLLCALGLAATLVPCGALAAQATGQISGSITNAEGAPVSGASVSVGSRGTLSSPDGRYLIEGVPVGTQTVRVSLIGYAAETAEVSVAAGQTATLNFQLDPQVVQLEGLVAVGYGTQAKVNLTGSVEAVGGEDLAKRPVANMSEALQGAAPGLTIIDRGGRPGDAATSVNIRGIGTLGNSNPLIVIDGVARDALSDLNDIDPNDVESISVLKDAASSAIYGSRAANGVILVTTKRGARDGAMSISYDGSYGIQNVAALPDRVGIEDYMRLVNTSYVNSGRPAKYSEEYIQNTVSGDDPNRYPDTDWLDVLFDPAPIQDHSIRLTGGNDQGAFSLSLNAMDQEGMLPNTHADRYGLRLNTDFQPYQRLQTGLDISLRRESHNEPHRLGDVLWFMLHSTPPTTVAKYPDGTYGWSEAGHNPLAYAEASGVLRRTITHGVISGQANYTLLDGLVLRTNAALQHGSWDTRNFREQHVFYDYFEPEKVVKTWTPNAMWSTKSNDSEVNLRAMLDYQQTFGEHTLSGLVGYEQIAHDWDDVSASREVFYNNELQEINVGDASRDGNSGRSESWRLRSGFGRIGYNYADKYLLEANARYDGSSRFAPGKQYGFFPSFSAGWRISEENFLRNVSWLNELKLRGSWGRLGNQQIGLYRYYSSIGLGFGYPFDGQLNNGARQTTLANEDIEWETTEMTNVGLDASFFDGRLTFAGDIYRKDTRGILLTLPIPEVIGLNPPVQNAGEVRNSGWETSLNWRDALGELDYSIGFSLADVQNEILNLAGTGPYINDFFINQEGAPISALYGYEALGIFQNEEEIANHATQLPLTQPGDIKFRDQNGDGVINPDDKIIIGSQVPRYTIGSNWNAAYRGLDFSLFFQGVLDVDAYITGPIAEGPVWENYTTSAWLDHWSPENPDAAMPRPRLSLSINTGPDTRSSFWVRDASYVKLRNAQVGYTMPASVTSRLGVQRLRLYLAGQNLLTFTGLDLALDPEFPSGRATVYPQTRTISIGTNLTF